MFAAALLCLSAVLAPAALQDPMPPPREEPAPQRPPVLGYLLLGGENEHYQLVRELAPSVVLFQGTLEACEEDLLRRLVDEHGTGKPNLTLPTFGGRQFWADVFWFGGWRIQENVLSSGFRLLDPADVRRAWGTREACRTSFETVRKVQGLGLESDHLVVLLHGLGRTRGSFKRMEDALREKGYEVASIGYPSTRRSLAEHASQLNQLLDRMEEVETVSFVTHSLGGLVVRAALAAEAPWRERIELGRVVMLAPPNRGSSLAEGVREFLPFKVLYGPSGQDVIDEASRIPAPPCEFGIVAARRSEGSGWNPLLDGEDDGVVSVEETKLEGAADFLVLAGHHTFLMNDAEVVKAVGDFLQQGAFARREEGNRPAPDR